MLQRYKQFALIALAASVAACSDSLGVGEEAFDADLTTQDLAAVESAFNSEAFLSLAVLGEQFSVTGAPTPQTAVLLQAAARPSAPGNAGRIQAAARQLQLMMAAGAAVELIPQEYRGLVFRYTGDGYVVDETQTGPANGIRFLLYAVNPITHDVVEPLNEIGYVDLLDESDDNTAAVRLVVVSDEVTFVDYVVSTSGPIVAPSFAIIGFLSDGDVRVDFDLNVALQSNIGGTSIVIDYSIDVADRDFGVDLHLTVAENDGGSSVAIVLAVSHGRNTVRIAGELQDETGTLEVLGNGELFATITFSETGLTVLNAAGEPLSDREEHALRELFDFVDEVVDVFEDLFDPVEFLFET